MPDILGKANGIATLDANAKLPQTQLPDISPDLSRVMHISLVVMENGYPNLKTWNAEFDCWILEVKVLRPETTVISINGETKYTPKYDFQTVKVDGNLKYIENSAFRCPFFVKKGTSISIDKMRDPDTGIFVAPCKYVNA